MMDAKAKILDKIKKCMALSKSASVHEATAALRQAMKLMEMHGVTDIDLLAADAGEMTAKAGATVTPANWEAVLAAKVAAAFGCFSMFRSCPGRSGKWVYLGCDASPNVAAYVFDVLRRQALKARAEYIGTQLRRVTKTATKTRRADLFSEGWALAATTNIPDTMTPETKTRINAYLLAHYPGLQDLETRDRNAGHQLRGHEVNDYWKGREVGRDAHVNRGVGAEQRMALEGK